MKYGMHNALTAYPLYGWQKCFSWLINAFSRCQSILMWNDAFDMQVALKNGEWYGSHGFAWYDCKLKDRLQNLDAVAKTFGVKTYLRLGYDHHFGCKNDVKAFEELIAYIQENFKDTIILYEYFIEKPWQLTTLIPLSIYERYWSLNWAKAQVKKHWWKFYLLLPLPRLWNKIYKKQWLKEYEDSGKEIFMTDFV